MSTSISKDVDLDAELYRQNSSIQYGLSGKLLGSHRFRAKARILDIGCGDGRITAEISKTVASGEVVGLDASESMISLASRTFSNEKYPNLQFMHAKIEEAFFSKKFDTIVSFSCLHWLRDPEKTLKYLCFLLKSGGDMLILTYPKESAFYKFMDEALTEFPEYRSSSVYSHMLPIKKYKKILESELEITSFEHQNLYASFNNEDELKAFIRGWLTSFVPLPESLHDAFLDAIAEKSRKHSVDLKNGMINLPYTALTISAKK